MLFGSEVKVLHTERKVIVDGWIELPVAAKTGVVFREIRALFDSFLTAVIEDSHSHETNDFLTSKTSIVVDDIVKLLALG